MLRVLTRVVPHLKFGSGVNSTRQCSILTRIQCTRSAYSVPLYHHRCLSTQNEAHIIKSPLPDIVIPNSISLSQYMLGYLMKYHPKVAFVSIYTDIYIY